MKFKVNEASGVVLDWMVAKCEGEAVSILDGRIVRPLTYDEKMEANIDYMAKAYQLYAYSTDPAQGFPIIEREQISVQHTGDAAKWRAHVWDDKREDFRPVMYGPTLLIAAMRCYVASKLGDEVEVPDELSR